MNKVLYRALRAAGVEEYLAMEAAESIPDDVTTHTEVSQKAERLERKLSENRDIIMRMERESREVCSDLRTKIIDSEIKNNESISDLRRKNNEAISVLRDENFKTTLDLRKENDKAISDLRDKLNKQRRSSEMWRFIGVWVVFVAILIGILVTL